MAKKITACKIDGLLVTELTYYGLTKSCVCKIGLSAKDVPMAQVELKGVNTLPGVQDALDALVDAIETAISGTYGDPEPGTEVVDTAPPVGLGDI